MEDISKQEVVLALRGLKSRKAAGPSEVTSEMFSLAGATGTDILLSVFRNMLRNDSSPGKWAGSITLPLFQGKGRWVGLRQVSRP